MCQTLTGLPDMAQGTEVKIISPDLLTVYAVAVVEDDKLAFQAALEPGREVRLLIVLPNATDKDALALYGSISPEGDDILLRFEERESPTSFRGWLSDERGITLHMGAEEGAGGTEEAAGTTKGDAAAEAAPEKAGTGGKDER